MTIYKPGQGARELPAHGEWSLDDIIAHLPDKPKFWSDHALLKLISAYQEAVERAEQAEKERDEALRSRPPEIPRYPFVALADYEKLEAELDRAKEEIADTSAAYTKAVGYTDQLREERDRLLKEIERLHEKYDFQRLVTENDRLLKENEELKRRLESAAIPNQKGAE